MEYQIKIEARDKGFEMRVLMVIQLEGVHRWPTLKVLRGTMKMIRLVTQNRAALNPAGPSGKKAQKKEDMLAVLAVSVVQAPRG